MRKFTKLAFGAKMASKCYPDSVKRSETYRSLEEEEKEKSDSVIIENIWLLC